MFVALRKIAAMTLYFVVAAEVTRGFRSLLVKGYSRVSMGSLRGCSMGSRRTRPHDNPDKYLCNPKKAHVAPLLQERVGP